MNLVRSGALLVLSSCTAAFIITNAMGMTSRKYEYRLQLTSSNINKV